MGNGKVRVDLTVINDPSLSWSAKGLWAYLSGIPDGECVYPKDILGHGHTKKPALDTILKELETAGYIQFEQEGNK